MKRIVKIFSGGQSGVDRAALDFALNNSIEYGGWCPKGGWAEDYPAYPGLLTKYKKLRETPSEETKQRTKWNVRDSDATIIVTDKNGIETSEGTELTITTAKKLNKPIYILNLDEITSVKGILDWLSSLKYNSIINIAGPRESESKGIYLKTYMFFEDVLQVYFL